MDHAGHGEKGMSCITEGGFGNWGNAGKENSPNSDGSITINHLVLLEGHMLLKCKTR